MLFDQNQRVVSRGPPSIACDPLFVLQPAAEPSLRSLVYSRRVSVAATMKYLTGFNPNGLNNGCKDALG